MLNSGQINMFNNLFFREVLRFTASCNGWHKGSSCTAFPTLPLRPFTANSPPQNAMNATAQHMYLPESIV